MTHFEVIVVGIGGHGSAALYHLAKQGIKVHLLSINAIDEA